MPAVPFKVKAVYDYQSQEPDDLAFSNGQIITVTDDTDEDWYTGKYSSSSGEEVEGIFPRNFVEKYEPAIPSRPPRAPKRAPAPEAVPEAIPAPEPPTEEYHPERVEEPEPELPKPAPQPIVPIEEPAASDRTDQPPPAASPPPAAVPAPKPATNRSGPPPVAEKPSSNSFKDRIAAFNKPAAAPVAPFKPGGNSGFIKKPFVAPPPSKNSYVPPPRGPPQKTYRREEDTAAQQDEERSVPPPPAPTTRSEDVDEDQPKPTSLKERIALLQKQQLEQAQKHADAAVKKEKPKRPAKKRTDPVDESEAVPAGPPTEDGLEKADTNETVGRASSDISRDAENERPQVQRHQSGQSIPTTQPVRELVSDTNDADDSGAGDTEDAQEISTEEDRPRSKGAGTVGHVEPERATKAAGADKEDEGDGTEEEAEEEDEDEEEEEDPEVRRRRELRDRMARLGGGVGMMGMFGPGGGAAPPPPRKSRPSQEHGRASEEHPPEDAARAPPVPIMALPGMSNQLPRHPTETADDDSDDEDKTAHPTPQEAPKHTDLDNDYVSQPPPPPRRSDTTRSSASIDRQAPPPPQRENRAPPPPPPETRAVPPPPPPGRPVPPRVPTHDAEEADTHIGSPTSPRARQSDDHPLSPTGAPPVPGRSRPDPLRKQSQDPSMSSPVTSPVARAPPPPLPAGPPSRRTTTDLSGSRNIENDSDEEVTEYDGDYDTDIASSAKHKDALKAHDRDSSIDDGVLTDDAAKSPKSPQTRSAPPLPPIPVHHAAPPPPPSQAPPLRKSTDAPRAAPPPVPPPAMPEEDNDEYDPYRYNSPSQGMPTPQLESVYRTTSPMEEREEDDMYGAGSQPPRMPPPPPADRAAPPPPPADRVVPLPPTPASPPSEPNIAHPKQSTDIRRSMTTSRRSMEQPRPSGEGFMARDIDLGHSSFWWTQPKLPPPSLMNRSDLVFEMEEGTSTGRGGRTAVSKDIFILYNDYSRTIINATFDQADPSQVNFEQRHERPPPPARKDELERASGAYGAQIASAASTFGGSGATVGDGSAQGFIYELLRPHPNALRPIGMRAYGALVYANLANASTQQFDEIRPGDIISFRNAKFSGHIGALKHKYTTEAGKPDHVAVVADWDGTKKKVRAWEQRSEDDRKEKKKAKVREESYRMGDLKSGEVHIWRVMGREYVGWDKA